MSTNHLELLKRSEVFSGLTDEQVQKILDLAQPKSYAEGEVIVEEDRPGSACYFLIKGRVDITVRAPFEGRGPQRLATIKGGELFGELSLVDGFLRSATALVVDDCEALAFDNEALEALMAADTAIGFRVMHNIANQLSKRIRESNMKLRNALADFFYY
jgi:CRP/FNR family transcriptional regulator, cyclic AMP receptor protein